MSDSKSIQNIINTSALSFIAFPFLGIIIPLIIWKSRNSTSPETDDMVKNLLNFQITWVLAWMAGPVLISIPYMINFWETISISRIDSWIIYILTYTIALYVINFIFILINTYNIQKGKSVKYRPSFRFLV